MLGFILGAAVTIFVLHKCGLIRIAIFKGKNKS